MPADWRKQKEKVIDILPSPFELVEKQRCLNAMRYQEEQARISEQALLSKGFCKCHNLLMTLEGRCPLA